MKSYIKPNTDIVYIKMGNQLLMVSGGEEQLRGGSNGDYAEGVTLGSRRVEIWDEEDFD